MATILSFLSGSQVTDDNGVVVEDAQLFHYQAGTTNDLTVYSNQAGSSARTQPVDCDAGGFVPLIYISDSSDWKVVIKDGDGVTLRTYDNLPKAVAEVSAADFAPPLLEWTQVTSASSPVALTAADAGKAYEADTTSGNIEFDLPSAASVGDGKGFTFKKTAAANNMVIDPNASETIDDSSTSFSTFVKDQVLGIFSNGAEWYRVFGHKSNRIAIQAFTASGTYTPTTGMFQCIVISTGAGGGGGGVDSDGTSCAGGGGGGAGGTCIETFGADSIGASQTVTIGTAGTAGAATGTNGGTGGDTTFGAFHTATGGAGGTGVAATGDNNVTAGGLGGTPTGGLINISGGDGEVGLGLATSGTTAVGGAGGASFWGGGGRSRASVGSNQNGQAGVAYGSGGSGAANKDDAAGNTGGAGAGGICVVIEFI